MTDRVAEEVSGNEETTTRGSLTGTGDDAVSRRTGSDAGCANMSEAAAVAAAGGSSKFGCAGRDSATDDDRGAGSLRPVVNNASESDNRGADAGVDVGRRKRAGNRKSE
jgi:hypothetical protein